MGALEFTFDLLHRAVEWLILGAGRKSVTYANERVRVSIPNANSHYSYII